MSISSVRSVFGSALLVASVVFSATHARAETEADLEKAKTLFDDARKLMSEGKYESACPMLEQSLAIAKGIGTRFNLADCEQHLEHYPRAQQLYLEVAEQARDAGQADREKVARERAAALESKLSRLKLELDAEQQVQIELDGHAVPQDAVKKPQAVTPGKHHLKASAEGKQDWNKDIDVPTPGLMILVSVPKLEAAVPAAAAAAAVKAEPAAKKESPPPNTTRGNGSRTAAMIVGGIGLGATVAGVAFGLQYLANNNDAKDVCPTGYGCSAEEIADHEKFVQDAHTARTWAYVGFGVGAAALTSAAILYFTAGKPDSVSATTGFNPDGSWNVAIRKRF